MKILITGASGNIGKGLIPRLREEGHDIVLYDVEALPETEANKGLPFIQGDIQEGIGLDRAAQGCDVIVHTPAWHGIHWNRKTEADFWRLNCDGTFWALQAAQAAGITRFVFLSSTAWYGHYDKYGFTKRIGEELCEYNRVRHGIRYVAIRPNDLTPYANFLHYGTRLLYGGVDRDDVLDSIVQAVKKLAEPVEGEPEGLIVHAVRNDIYTDADLAEWQEDAAAACERIFPGSRDLIAKYGLDISHRPHVHRNEDGVAIGFTPKRHFGTFIEELRHLDATIGPEGVAALKCPY